MNAIRQGYELVIPFCVLVGLAHLPTRLHAAPETDAPRRPNVLFIAVDDLRPELGCYGVKAVHSPNIDRLQATGMAFERAYCQLAVCNPSRVSLLTGLRPDSARVWDLATEFRKTIPDAVTLPQHFKTHGYYAVSYGKIFHNPWPDNQSWDEPHRWPKAGRLWSDKAMQDLDDYREKMRGEGKPDKAIHRMRAAAVEVVDIPESEHIDGAIAEQSIEAMRRVAGKDQPFFLAVGFIRPHLPFVVPRKYWEMYDRATFPLADNPRLPKDAPPFAMNTMYELRDYMDYAGTPDPLKGSLTEAQQRELKHGYYASVSFIDAQIGRLLDELDRLGLSDNTIVVLWGDHGWKLGEHNSWCKQTNYEIDTRAPLIVRDPRLDTVGRSTKALVEFVDVYPSLCDLAGLPTPDHLEGKSFGPLIRGIRTTHKDAAISQFPRRVDGRQLMGYAMRTQRYRYVEWIERGDGRIVAQELYDHSTDPAETTNLAAKPEVKTIVDGQSKRMWSILRRPESEAAQIRTSATELNQSTIVFRNARAEPVAIYWLPEDGQRRRVGTIQPRAILGQKTTIGHRFLAVGEQTGRQDILAVSKAEQTVELEQPADTLMRDAPNIVVIMGDDWSWPHAGILGDAVVKTPTFDRIAKEGVLFQHAYVSSPSCTPSRLAIATGQHHWRLREGASLGGSLPANVPVYADILKAAGYRTGFCRKGAEPSKNKYRETDPFGERFRDFKQFFKQPKSGQPFCFWYGAGEPHRPYDWKASLKSNVQLDRIVVPPYLPDNETVRTDLGDYYLRVQKLDRLAGEILRMLEEAGELENTIVVMTGDNGMPFPRCKATLYGSGTRAPLAIRWGNRVQAGAKFDGFVSLTDLAPTFLEAAGLPVPEQMTGRSLMKILTTGRDDLARDHVLVGMEQHVYPWPSRAIRNGEFLYITNFAPQTWPTGQPEGLIQEVDFAKKPWPQTPGSFSYNCDLSPTKQWMITHKPPQNRQAFGPRSDEELYDLRKDPQQLKNVADDPAYAPAKRALAQQLARELRSAGDDRSQGSHDRAAHDSEIGSAFSF